MERKIAKLLALTGIVIGAAVAFMPTNTHAAEIWSCDPSNPSTKTVTDSTGRVWGVEDLGAWQPGDPLDVPVGGCASMTSDPKQVKVTIKSQISLDAVNGVVINAVPYSIETGNLSATVSSTHPYTISLSATQPNLVNTKDSTLTIPAMDNFTKNNIAWGIKKQDATSYSAITPTPTVFFTNANNGNSIVTNFEVGVAVTNQTTPGTYQTDVTVTAAIKQ